MKPSDGLLKILVHLQPNRNPYAISVISCSIEF